MVRLLRWAYDASFLVRKQRQGEPVQTIEGHIFRSFSTEEYPYYFTEDGCRYRSMRYKYKVGIGRDEDGEKDNLVEWLNQGLFHNTYRLLNTDLDGSDGLLAVLIKECMKSYCTVDYAARILSADDWYAARSNEGRQPVKLRSRARARVMQEFQRAQDDLGWIKDLTINRQSKHLTGHEKLRWKRTAVFHQLFRTDKEKAVEPDWQDYITRDGFDDQGYGAAVKALPDESEHEADYRAGQVRIDKGRKQHGRQGRWDVPSNRDTSPVSGDTEEERDWKRRYDQKYGQHERRSE